MPFDINTHKIPASVCHDLAPRIICKHSEGCMHCSERGLQETWCQRPKGTWPSRFGSKPNKINMVHVHDRCVPWPSVALTHEAPAPWSLAARSTKWLRASSPSRTRNWKAEASHLSTNINKLQFNVHLLLDMMDGRHTRFELGTADDRWQLLVLRLQVCFGNCSHRQLFSPNSVRVWSEPEGEVWQANRSKKETWQNRAPTLAAKLSWWPFSQNELQQQLPNFWVKVSWHTEVASKAQHPWPQQARPICRSGIHFPEKGLQRRSDDG